MKIHYIIVAAVMLVLAGCKQNGAEQASPVSPQEAEQSEPTAEAVPNEAAAGEADLQESYFESKAKTAAKAPAAPAVRSAAKAAPEKKSSQAETIYVETEGAQGRVWGHVTMRGDRGTGTIHDWDENTLAVSVTRHGNELFAVDQNSRQYVFKLKQNKTQE